MAKQRKRLTDKRVLAIKEDIVSGQYTQDEVARRNKTTRSTVSNITTGRQHTNIPWPGEVSPPQSGGQRKAIPEYDPSNLRIKELEADLLHVTEERNHARRVSKAHVKESGLFQAAVSEIEARCKIFTPLPSQVKAGKKQQIIEDLVLHLSDGHHDSVVTKAQTGGLEEYNFPISCARAEKLVNTIIEWSQSSLSNFHFQTLWILANGDHTSGEIHGHEKRSYFKNQFKNSLAIGQLHGMMFRDLAAHFEKINCVYVPGNHGRRTAKKDHHGAHENWDYLVAKTAQLHCSDIENISFLIPNAFSVNLLINGHGMNLSHGDDVRGSLGLPVYGMMRRQKSLLALQGISGHNNIRYFAMGHHHTACSLSDGEGEFITNGAWLATDAFSYNAFSGYRDPCQILHGMHHKYGISWRLPVRLKHADETKGPKRYKIALED